MKNRVPVRSRKDKHSTGSLVVGSVTTSESGLLYVFTFFLETFFKKFPFDYIVPKSEPKVVEIPKVRVVLGVGREDSDYRFENLTIKCVLYQNRFTMISSHRIIHQTDLQSQFVGVSRYLVLELNVLESRYLPNTRPTAFSHALVLDSLPPLSDSPIYHLSGLVAPSYANGAIGL